MFEWDRQSYKFWVFKDGQIDRQMVTTRKVILNKRIVLLAPQNWQYMYYKTPCTYTQYWASDNWSFFATASSQNLPAHSPSFQFWHCAAEWDLGNTLVVRGQTYSGRPGQNSALTLPIRYREVSMSGYSVHVQLNAWCLRQSAFFFNTLGNIKYLLLFDLLGVKFEI